MSRITVIGSSNIDFVMRMERLPMVGESVTDAEFMQTFGGKGANQAVAAARAGGAVSFVNCVGNDPYAAQMVANFERDGIDTTHIYHETDVPSGTALIMVGESGNNYLGVAPGANYRLTPERVEAKRSLIAQSAMVLIQYEIVARTAVRILQIANEERTPVLFNFAPARSFPAEHLSLVHTLVVNESEAAALAGRPVADDDDARSAAKALLETGSPVVIVTLGAGGSIVATRQNVTHVPAYAVEAVDSTAAGDTYCGCLATALAEGKALDEAVRFASAAAALSVRRMGAQPSTPWRTEIERFLEDHRD